MSNYLVCYIVNTVFGQKKLYKHFDSITDIIDFVDEKKSDFGVLDIFVYESMERY